MAADGIGRSATGGDGTEVPAEATADRPTFLQRRLRDVVEGILEPAGIAVDGDAPWDPQIHDARFFRRVLTHGSLGLGESYMDGWWDCSDLPEFFHRLLRYGRTGSRSLADLWHGIRAVLFNLQTRLRSKVLADVHYDLDADVFMSFLDRYNQYTCGYFKDTDDLDEAQENKLELICRKLRLRPGLRVLDIGCGWGGFARYAAERHGVEVTGVTISEEQAAYARDFCDGLPVEIVETDYRDLDAPASNDGGAGGVPGDDAPPGGSGGAGSRGPFDRILACGLLEHVGYKNYRTLMETAAHNLVEDGLFLIQTIGRNSSTVVGDPWMNRYIFPNSMLPSLKQITGAVEGLFVLEDLHNFGVHYEKTLLAWYERFRSNFPSLRHRFDERFFRMWNYYLLSCAGAFRARRIQLWQVVLSSRGVAGGYVAPR